MLKFFSKYKFFGIVMLVISTVIISIIYNLYTPEKRLPVFQPNEVTRELVDSSLQRVRKYHKISDFEVINQYGEVITQDTFKDKIYITDFFFTTCQAICPIMTKHMLQIQNAYKDDNDILLLSHTVMPEIDSVEVLYSYAKENNAIKNKWHLVTGEKKEIYALARKSYFTSKTDGDGGKYDLIHTENFVLIDKEKRIRGFYDGTKPEEIKKAIEDINLLKNEYLKD